jgi:hypothetical protein
VPDIEGERDGGGASCGGRSPLRDAGGALATREGGGELVETWGAAGMDFEAEVLLGGPEKDLGVGFRGGGGVAAGADVVSPAFWVCQLVEININRDSKVAIPYLPIFSARDRSRRSSLPLALP